MSAVTAASCASSQGGVAATRADTADTSEVDVAGTDASPAAPVTSTIAPAATAVPTLPTAPSVTAPTSDPAPTDPVPPLTEPLGGSAHRPEGTWTLFMRQEVPDPPYDSFVAGQPLVRQWQIHPQCDDGVCPLRIEPGANGFLPDSAPPDGNGLADPFVLEPQADGSYVGDNTYEAAPCTTSGGSSLDGGSTMTYHFSLTFSPAEDGAAPTLRGTKVNNSVPNAAGLAAGCIEYHDTESVIGQPLDAWASADASRFTYGTYDWGGLVSAADDTYLADVAAIGDYRHFVSVLTLDPSCSSPCTLHESGAVPAYDQIGGTFTVTGSTLTSDNTWQDTCVSNDTHQVIVEHGYDNTNTVQLRPAIVVHGEVLALVGHYVQHATPTAEASAASPADCTVGLEEYDVYAATTRPYFDGL